MQITLDLWVDTHLVQLESPSVVPPEVELQERLCVNVGHRDRNLAEDIWNKSFDNWRSPVDRKSSLLCHPSCPIGGHPSKIRSPHEGRRLWLPRQSLPVLAPQLDSCPCNESTCRFR